MQYNLNLETSVVASEHTVSCDLMGEAVILDISSGTYFGLDAVGAEAWTFIQEPKAVRNLVDHLVAQYDVLRDECESETLALLRDLASNKLIVVHEKTIDT